MTNRFCKKLAALTCSGLLILPLAAPAFAAPASAVSCRLEEPLTKSRLSGGYSLELGPTQNVWVDEADNATVYSAWTIGVFTDRNGTHPQLKRAVEAFLDEQRNQALDDFARLKTVSLDNKAAVGAGRGRRESYGVSAETDIAFADDTYLALRTFHYISSGGAHPNYAYQSQVFHVKDGTPVKLTELCPDLPALMPEILSIAKEKHPEQTKALLSPDSFFAAVIESEGDKLCWFPCAGGIQVYFNPYEITPFAAGTIKVTITRAAHPELFK